MIAIDSIRKLNTAVIYVTDPLGLDPGVGLQLGASAIDLGQLIEAPEVVQQSAEGIVISSMRNQFAVTIAPNRLQFFDRSGEEPARADFGGRVVGVSEHISNLSGLTYTAIGLNFDIESRSASEELPSHAMLDRIIRDGVLTDTKYSVIGASARLWYTAAKRRYDLRIEPRGNQYDGADYYAHLNAHIVLEGSTPSAQWLSSTLQEEYKDFKRILIRILNQKRP